jgi:hypothetical protein
MNNGEVLLKKVLCPEGHDALSVTSPGVYHCSACLRNYKLTDLITVPVVRSPSVQYHPTVYGKLN